MAEKGFGVKEINLIGASGTPTIESPNNLNLNAVNVAISTNATIGGNLTVTGTVGIAGTLTYEDVTNVDAIGIVTAREGVFVPDTKLLKIGNTAADPDLQIHHTSGNHSIVHTETGNLSLSSNSGYVQLSKATGDGTSNYVKMVEAKSGDSVDLYYNGNKKIETSNTGATVTGTLVATTFSGSGASLTNLPAGNLTGTLPAISGANLTGIAVTEAPVTDYTISANGSSAYRIHGGGVDETANSPDLYLIRGQKYRFNNTTGSGHPFAIRVSNGGSAYTDGVSGSNQGVQFFTVPYAAPASLVYQCTIHGGMVGNIYIRGGASTAAISNNADNRVITGGSGGNLNGESGLTFDGSKLTVTSSSKDLLYLNSTHTSGVQVPFQASGTTFAYIGSAQTLFNTGTSTDLGIRAESSKNILFGIAGNEKLRITSSGTISFDQGTTAAVTPSQSTASSVGHQTMSGGSSWFNHGSTTDYFGVDGDWKLTNGATYGKIVARNTQGAISNATEAGHTWFLVCKTVAGTLGNSNWVVEPVAGWKMAWPVPLIAGGVATFYMRDAIESYGSPTIPSSGDYYIGWFYSPSQQMGTNGGSYYVDASSGGKIYYYSGEGDMSNPHQRIPRQGDSWDATMTGEKIHFRFETLPKADLTGTVFASPLLVDPVIQGTPLIDGLPMAGGQLVKDVQWATNVSSVEYTNADFVNCNYLVTYSINGSDGSSNTSGWFQTRLQFCDHTGDFFDGTNDYISHTEWNHSTSNDPSINTSYAGYQRSIWLTGNGSDYDHEGYVWIIPSNFRHNRDQTISQRWGNNTEFTSNTHPRIFVRGHSHLSTGVDTTHYREEGGGTYRGTNGVFNISGFRLYGSASSNFHAPASNGSSNGYVRIWRFRSGFETRE